MKRLGQFGSYDVLLQPYYIPNINIIGRLSFMWFVIIIEIGLYSPYMTKTAICKNHIAFLIFDAKYYNPVLLNGHTPKNQPGIESVTKQYLYQLAYQNFITDHCFTQVRNCFLLPTTDSGITDKGELSLVDGLFLVQPQKQPHRASRTRSRQVSSRAKPPPSQLASRGYHCR